MKNIQETHPNFFKDECPDDDFLVIKKFPNQEFYFHQSVVQKHTIDKAVLKKVIERICLQTGAEITKAHLFIELGLEEE